MLNYAKLADISKWQGDIDYNIFSSQDLSGVIARAGSINYVTGIPYTDYKFEINADKCAELLDAVLLPLPAEGHQRPGSRGGC